MTGPDQNFSLRNLDFGERRGLGQIQIEFARGFLEKRVPPAVKKALTRRRTPSESFSAEMSPGARALVSKQIRRHQVANTARRKLPARRICSAKYSSDSIKLPSAICTGGWSDAIHRTARRRQRFLHPVGQFLDEPAIDLTRPVEAVAISELAALDGGDTGFLHRDEDEVGGDRRGKMQSRPRAQVVCYALHPFKKIKSQEPDATNEHENENGQNDRRAFERFELHRAQLNKKPEQLKAALVLTLCLQKLRPMAATVALTIPAATPPQ